MKRSRIASAVVVATALIALSSGCQPQQTSLASSTSAICVRVVGQDDLSKPFVVAGYEVAGVRVPAGDTAQLVKEIKAQRKQPSTGVVVAASQNAPFSLVEPAIQAAADAGLTNLSLAVEPPVGASQATEMEAEVRLSLPGGGPEVRRSALVVAVRPGRNGQAELQMEPGGMVRYSFKDLQWNLVQRRDELPPEVAGLLIVSPRSDSGWAAVVAAVQAGREAGFTDVILGMWSEAMRPHLIKRKNLPTTLILAGGVKSTFFGTTSAARHVCYVVDCSGSMIDTFDHVREQILVSISRLRMSQDFHIIVFTLETPTESPQRKLIPANVKNKEEAVKFLESIRPQRQTGPIPALNRAFDVLAQVEGGPQDKVICLLTDGVFPDNNSVLKVIADRNRDKKVTIHTFLYGDKPPEAVKVMKDIASQNGGTYKFVSADE